LFFFFLFNISEKFILSHGNFFAKDKISQAVSVFLDKGNKSKEQRQFKINKDYALSEHDNNSDQYLVNLCSIF